MQVQKVPSRILISAYLIWCLCWVLLQTFALTETFEFPLELALKDSLTTNALIAGCGYAMISMMRFYSPGRLVRLLLTLIFALICAVAILQIGKILISNDPEYLEFLRRSMIIRGLYIWLMVTLVTTLAWLWYTLQDQQEIQKRNASAEQLAREAELARLRQQLQPHFLFNSLNSISALAGTKPDQARKMIQQLSDFLRGTLKKDDQQLVTLAEELDHLSLYLDIERVRFGHRLQIEINRSEDALNLKLPSLLLQPVVENAIKFGLYDTIGETTIRIDAASESGFLSIEVKNPFDPSTSAPRHGTGFGLNSIQRRLYLLYGRQDLITTRQDENTFITEIKIPQLL